MVFALVYLFLLSLVAMVWGTIAPAHVAKVTRSKNVLPRKHIAVRFGVVSVLLFILIGFAARATAPKSAGTPQKIHTQSVK